MKIAYLILAHKGLGQVVSLINKLAIPNSTHFFIHIDKSKYTEEEIKNLNSDVASWSSVYSTPWASFNVVKAELYLIKKALLWNADRLVMLSGQDYPIKSNDNIVDFFVNHSNEGFIAADKMPVVNWDEHQGGLYRVNRAHFLFGKKWRAFPLHTKKKPLNKLFNRVANLFHKKFLATPQIEHYYVGSHWWAITRIQAEYIKRKAESSEILRAFKYSRHSDEVFIHSILYNAPNGVFDIKNQSLHYVKGLHDSPHPDLLVEEDFNVLLGSPFLFARKFDVKKSATLKGLLDHEI